MLIHIISRFSPDTYAVVLFHAKGTVISSQHISFVILNVCFLCLFCFVLHVHVAASCIFCCNLIL